tara:strand:- start:309 stop:833 length:525 start_codon:yes stop_codon:yes gene_type:complete
MANQINKLFIIPILFAFAFSQNVDNQISYTIYTDTKSYPDVTLLSVQGKGLIVNEKNGIGKYNIYIPYINRIKIIEGGSKPIGRPLGCIWLGALGGGLIGLGLDSITSSPTDVTGGMFAAIPLFPIALLGGMMIGVLAGSIEGDNPYASQAQFVSLEDKSLDEKIDYLKSIAEQ